MTQPSDIAALRQAVVRSHQDGAQDKALAGYARYLALVPGDAGMWSNYGALMRAMGRHNLARIAQERAFALDPDAPGVRNNLANILSDLGAYERSIQLRQAILRERPGDAQQGAMIGRCLRGQGQYAQAVAWLETAAQAHPDDAEFDMQRALALLADGQYAAGFTAYHSRWRTGEVTAQDMPMPEWRGEPIAGKRLMVLSEQGLGDTVLFARFLPVAQATGARVRFVTDAPVRRLLGGQEPGAADLWCNLVDLAVPHFHAGGQVPAPPALTIPQDSRDRAQRIVAPFDRLKVGVNWCGSLTYRGNAFRSFGHERFTALADLPIQMVSLYKGPRADQFRADGSAGVIVDAAATDRDMADCAAMIDQMDLVITSDTATAHIAGALGKPVWVLLHWDPFWVYGHSGQGTDWYPSMVLYRQARPLDWDGVFARVRRDLESLC